MQKLISSLVIGLSMLPLAFAAVPSSDDSIVRDKAPRVARVLPSLHVEGIERTIREDAPVYVARETVITANAPVAVAAVESVSTWHCGPAMALQNDATQTVRACAWVAR